MNDKILKKFRLEYKMDSFDYKNYTNKELLYILEHSEILNENRLRLVSFIMDIVEFNKNDITFLQKVSDTMVYQNLDEKSYLRDYLENRIKESYKSYSSENMFVIC